MRLTESEYYQYLRIHKSLLHYVGVNEKLIPKDVAFEDFMQFSAQEIFPSRNRLYEKPRHIDKFVKENPYDLSQENLDIAQAFQHFKKGRYFVIKYLKDYTIFLDEEYAYGVLALSDPFQGFFGDNLPAMVEAVLLPFKDKIVYDGILQGSRISFGRSISSSIKNDYNKAKAKYGIITSLPIDKKTKKAEFTDEDKLRLYMKNASSRDQYWYEIQDLIKGKPALERLYYHLWGKVNSRDKRKSLKEIGIKNFYFAIYDDVIIASGKTKQEVEARVKEMLKKGEVEAVYIFKI